MSSQKKGRKGSGKLKNLEPRKLAARQDEDVKGGGGTLLSASPLQTVDSVANSLAATYDAMSKQIQDAHLSQQQVLTNLRG